MGSEWLKNMGGSHLEDEAMQKIPYPKTELTVHVTTKTIQAFGLLGTVLVGPIVAVVRKDSRNWPGIKSKMTKCGRNGLFLGAFMGPFMVYMKIKNEEDPYKTWDRCYRLRYNRDQVRVDRASVVGSLTGAAVGSATASGAMFGGLVGLSTSIIAMAIYNNAILKKDK
ncbi:hypothetical protein ACF0H5_008272 [Mactra antiquata]